MKIKPSPVLRLTIDLNFETGEVLLIKPNPEYNLELEKWIQEKLHYNPNATKG